MCTVSLPFERKICLLRGEFKWHGSLTEPGFLSRESENFTSTSTPSCDVPVKIFELESKNSLCFSDDKREALRLDQKYHGSTKQQNNALLGNPVNF